MDPSLGQRLGAMIRASWHEAALTGQHRAPDGRGERGIAAQVPAERRAIRIDVGEEGHHYTRFALTAGGLEFETGHASEDAVV